MEWYIQEEVSLIGRKVSHHHPEKGTTIGVIACVGPIRGIFSFLVIVKGKFQTWSCEDCTLLPEAG